MATIGGIGIGLFIIILIWVVALVLSVALSRAQGAISNAPIGIILGAVVITLILLFIPRGPIESGADYIIYDQNYNTRVAILSISGIVAFLGILMYVPLVVFEPTIARPLRGKRI